MTYKLEAITDERDTCEICGKTNLRQVMILRDADGEFVAAGTTCGARALGISKPVENMNQVKRIVDRREEFMLAVESAQKMARECGDEIGILRRSDGFAFVRGQAFDAAPERYGTPIRWVKAVI